MYRELEVVLRKEYGNITVDEIKPLHDEDFEPCYAVCRDNVIICRADLPLKKICEELEA